MDFETLLLVVVAILAMVFIGHLIYLVVIHFSSNEYLVGTFSLVIIILFIVTFACWVLHGFGI